jgi:hypothetical protein
MSAIGPVKAYLCKTQAQSLLNKLCSIQAFHNGVNLDKFTLSRVNDTPTISSNSDRLEIIKEFTAHIKDILSMLNQLVQDKNLDDFMGILGEETKNLAARLGKQDAIDKKVER